MPRRDLPGITEERAGRRHEPIYQVFVERRGPEIIVQKTAGAGGAKLTREPPGAIGDANIERLYADRISSEPEFIPAQVEGSKRVDAVQPLEQRRTTFLPTMHQHFGVGRGPKPVTHGFQLAPQLEMVVQLTVHHDPEALVLVGHRLRSALDVHDAEAAMAEAYRVLAGEVKARAVRTPVRERGRDVEPLLQRLTAALARDDAGDT